MANWLSTRVEVRGSHLIVAPDHDSSASERALVASQLARARALGLVVVPGAYLPRPKCGDAGSSEQEHDEKAPHLIYCAA
jgi:hypothetical protein